MALKIGQTLYDFLRGTITANEPLFSTQNQHGKRILLGYNHDPWVVFPIVVRLAICQPIHHFLAHSEQVIIRVFNHVLAPQHQNIRFAMFLVA